MNNNKFSRRDFLESSTLGAFSYALGASGTVGERQSQPVTIERIEVFPVSYPVKGEFKFLEGGRLSAVVKIIADDGAVGWGESIPSHLWSYETMETVTTTIRNYLAPPLIGHNVFDLNGIHQIMNQQIAPSFQTGQPIAKSGVDMALHDLIGRITNQSLSQMWGRMPGEEITLSWTLNPSEIDELESLIEEGRRQGYQHFNVKVGTTQDFDLALCKHVKEQVPDGFLWADANGGYDRMTAMEIAPKLADIGVEVLEQPLPSNRLTGYRDLKRQGALPILMDEGIVSHETLMEFIRLDLLDGIAMKLPRCGGLMSAKRQMEIIEDAGLMFLGSGLTDPGLSLAATLQLYGAFNYGLPAALNGPQFLAGSILKDPLQVKRGRVSVPAGPGLGVEVDESKVQELSIEI